MKHKNQEHKPVKKEPVKEEPVVHEAQYKILAGRRQNSEQLTWQTPMLILTGQSFLLTIALAADTSNLSRILAAILGMFTAGASIHSMYKHKKNEIRDSHRLLAFEQAADNQKKGYKEIHGKEAFKISTWLGKQVACDTWMFVLIAYYIVMFAIMILAIINPDLLK